MLGELHLASRRKVVVASLIAFTSMLGAVSAWRASVAAGEGGGAEGKSQADALAAAQTRATLESFADQTRYDYLRARVYQAFADELESQAGLLSFDDGERLRTYAESVSAVAETIRSGLDPDAIRPDGTLDTARSVELQFGVAASQRDLDPEPELAVAAAARQRAERLVGLTALLIAGALFFTLAQVSRSRASGLYLAGGLGVLGLAAGLMVGVELL